MTPTTTPTATAPETLVPVIGEYIAIKPGHCGGKPHVAGHRIKVQHIAVWHERLGMTAAEIVATYPSLTLPAVYAALAYYHSHRGEIDADIAADEQFVKETKAKTGSSRLQQLDPTGACSIRSGRGGWRERPVAPNDFRGWQHL